MRRGKRSWKSVPAKPCPCYEATNVLLGRTKEYQQVFILVGQVCYYRYLRFVPGGRFLYRTSPQPLREVARSLLRPAPVARALRRRGRPARPLPAQSAPGVCSEHCCRCASTEAVFALGMSLCAREVVHCS